MKIKTYITLFFLIWAPLSFASEACNVLVHGFTFGEAEDYFGDIPHQVKWDATEEIEYAAPKLARALLDEFETCPEDAPVILRPHSYGGAMVQYILGKGHLFQDAFPDHDFVLIYNRVIEVYAYTSAYRGTPLMDIVCANRVTKAIAELLGTSCVYAISTSEVDNVASKVTTPGVPTHLIFSSNRSGFFGVPGGIVARYLLTKEQWKEGLRNQNDNTLPTYATRACAVKAPLTSNDKSCKKLDSFYFKDFKEITEFNHLQFRMNEDIMLMRKK